MARSAKKETQDATPRNLGRYRLYGELASGGMATVHLGRQVGSGGFSKMVAIKRLHPQFGKIDEFVEMFLAEARLASRIRHPNVVQPLDVLRVEDEVFLVMEYVEGDSLSRLMKATVARQEKVPLPIAVAILSGVLRGLHAAHEAKNDKGEPLGLVHRDVSPQNVLVAVDGAARVIDFGIAKAADSVEMTREGELKGKLAYIAPEILGGHRGTRRSDLYAAAVVLWEVITAQRLFDADYQSAIVANILHRPVDPPSDFIADLPPALDRVVMKGLARDPSDRYATCREMAVALEEAVPAASPALVGEWVESVAAISLQNRGSRVAKIEALSSTEVADDDGAEEVRSEFMSVSTANPPVVGPKASSAPPPPMGEKGRSAPPPPPPPPPPRPAPSRSPTLPSQWLADGAPGPSALEPPPPPPTPPSPYAPTVPQPAVAPVAPGPPPPNIVVSNLHMDTPQWPVQGIAPAPVPAAMMPRDAAKARSSGSGIVVLILTVALVVALLYVGLPEFLRRSYATAAAQQGVTLTLDSVEVGFRHVRLLGLTATMADLPGVSLHAKSVDVGMSLRLDPTDAAMHDPVLTIDGTVASMRDSVDRASTAHDFKALREGTLRQLTVDAGHVIWSRAFGEGTRFEAENISLAAERNGSEPLGDDVTAASPIVVVTAPWGKLGPWAMTGQLDHGKTKTTVTLDPSGASKAAASFVVDHGSVVTFDLSLPRSNVGLLGVGAPVVARRPEDAFFGEGEAHYAARSASKIEASMRLSLSGLRLPAAMSGADAQLEGRIEGDPAKPIDVARGVFSFGPFRGAVTGSLQLGDGFLRADLSFRTGGIHCASGGDVALGGGLSVDTRKLAEAQLALTPGGHCPMKILPP
jgi:serine/threonine-protein kinase